MQPDDEQARLKEVERAHQARAITESPLWDEAYQKLVNAQLSRMLAKSTSDDEVLECKRRILAIQDIKGHFASIMTTGAMAQQQLDEAYK